MRTPAALALRPRRTSARGAELWGRIDVYVPTRLGIRVEGVGAWRRVAGISTRGADTKVRPYDAQRRVVIQRRRFRRDRAHEALQRCSR